MRRAKSLKLSRKLQRHSKEREEEKEMGEVMSAFVCDKRHVRKEA